MSEEMERSARSEIFGGQQHQPGMPTRNVMKDDFDFEVPVESVPIPTRGVVYPHDSTLHSRETVDIKGMTAREEDILTSRALIKKGTVITELLRSCITDKNINPDDMLVGDRNALMTAVRITGYGAEYNCEISCPECGEKSKHDFDLTSLPIKRLKIEPVADGTNTFEVELPMTKKTIRFKFLTGNDEREMVVTQERRKKQGMKADSLVTERFSRQIVSVGTVNEKNKINMFVRNMPARDSLFLRKYIDDNEPGIDMTSWMVCPHCDEHSEVRLPMGATFFWPDA
tara:strand:+ start:19050 stop:19904 length:855 start_codon:yes stop_codon:yes gene_type:complete